MRRRSRVPVLVLSLVLAALLGACADGRVREANGYVAAVNRAQAAFSARSDRLVAQIGPDTAGRRREVRARLVQLYGALDTFVGRLRTIRPPPRVTALHARLIAALVGFGGRLRAAGTGLTSADPSRILDGQGRLAEATAAVSRAINATIAAINARLKGA